MAVAQISEFDLQEDFSEWCERFDMYLIANQITDEKRKQAMLIAGIGAAPYKLMRSLCQNKVSDKGYGELIKIMLEHLNPKPNEIAERYKFHKRDRKPDESVSTYVAVLRKMSEHCGFGDRLNEQLRDRFVCGINSQRVLQRLIGMRDLTLEKAIETAISIEVACRDVKEMQGGIVKEESGSNMNRFTPSTGRKECYRCGDSRHLADACPFKLRKCYACDRIGHTRRRCRSSMVGGSQGSGMGKDRRATGGSGSTAPTHLAPVLDFDEEDESEIMELYPLDLNSKHKPVMVEVEMNGRNLRMELYTGAAVTVMSESDFERVKTPQNVLSRSKLRLRTYTGEIVRPGVSQVEVVYRGQKCTLPVTVVVGNVPTLLGRDWLASLKLDWNGLFPRSASVNAMRAEPDDLVKELTSEYKAVFSEN